MFRQLLPIAAVACAGLMPAQAADPVISLTPDPAGETTNLATIKFTFDGLEMLTQQKIDKISASLTNETTGDRYVAVKVQYSYSEWNAATLFFGAEGSDTPAADISADGTYTLTVAAGSFKSEMVDPTYLSPEIRETYTIGGEPADEMSAFTLTPAPGDVADIQTITVKFPDTGFMGIKVVDTAGITLTYKSHNGLTTREARVVKSIYTFGDDCGLQFDWTDATEKEPMTFITPGIYTLDIPAGAFAYFSGSPASRHITANYTIPQEGGVMSTPSVQPRPGEVSEIGTVTLNFGNAAHNLEFADDLSAITITRKGERKATWHCSGASASNYTATLTFAREGSDEQATISTPGEYLFTIPAGMISGYTPDGTKTNDGLQYLYTIIRGTDNMAEWSILPDSDTVEQIGNIVITFGNVQEAITQEEAAAGISLAFTPDGEESATETYRPRGNQRSGKTVTLLFGKAADEPLTAPGTYTLTIPQGAFSEDGNTASVSPAIEKTYTILPIEATGISVTPDRIDAVPGTSVQLTATVTPDDTTDKTIVWTSSDETVATVDADGLVSILKAASCEITATCGNVTATCQVDGTNGMSALSGTRTAGISLTTPDVLTVTGIEGAFTLRLYSADGTAIRVYELEGETDVNIGSLPAGVYVARIEGVTALRFIR